MGNDYRRHLAFKAGRKAALNGKPDTANNREWGTIFFDDWADGWQAGERETPNLSPQGHSHD